MKNKVFSIIISLLPATAFAQSAIDAYTLSQNDFRGTARFMAMGGAFGALGGDITSIVQNPAGIGVYRSSDISATLDVDMQSTQSQNASNKVNQTKVSCNSFGYVGAFRLNGESLRTLNWGFSYNRNANRAHSMNGQINSLQSSLSNYVAGVTNAGGWTVNDLAGANYATTNAPWMSVLSYDASIINPTSDGKSFQGLYGDGTTGYGEFEVIEEGGVDEFNFSLGGNVKDMVYWGVTVGVTDLDYKLYSYYGEKLDNAYVNSDLSGVGDIVRGSGSFCSRKLFAHNWYGIQRKIGFDVTTQQHSSYWCSIPYTNLLHNEGFVLHLDWLSISR